MCCETQQLDNLCGIFERAKGELVVVIVVLVESWFVLAPARVLAVNNRRRWSRKSQQWCGCLMEDHLFVLLQNLWSMVHPGYHVV